MNGTYLDDESVKRAVAQRYAPPVTSGTAAAPVHPVDGNLSIVGMSFCFTVEEVDAGGGTSSGGSSSGGSTSGGGSSGGSSSGAGSSSGGSAGGSSSGGNGGSSGKTW